MSPSLACSRLTSIDSRRCNLQSFCQTVPTAFVRAGKITIGRGSSGFPIVVAPLNDGLGLAITEGAEDALSVHAATGLGAWASGGSGRMPALAVAVPAFVEAVTIFQHPDAERQRKGLPGRARWRLGVPHPPGASIVKIDVNDFLRNYGCDALRDDIDARSQQYDSNGTGSDDWPCITFIDPATWHGKSIQSGSG